MKDVLDKKIDTFLEHHAVIGMKQSDIEVEDFLEHFGIKGQKWGVRQQQRLESTKRVASGNARPGDKSIVLGKQSLISLIRGRGLKGAAARDVLKLEAKKKRIKSGKAKTSDLLNKWGLVNLGGAN